VEIFFQAPIHHVLVLPISGNQQMLRFLRKHAAQVPYLHAECWFSPLLLCAISPAFGNSLWKSFFLHPRSCTYQPTSCHPDRLPGSGATEEEPGSPTRPILARWGGSGGTRARVPCHADSGSSTQNLLRLFRAPHRQSAECRVLTAECFFFTSEEVFHLLSTKY
jgi:hypothetical protein